MPKKLNIQVKQEGQLFSASEANQIVEAINENYNDLLKPSHAFAEPDFIEDGTITDEDTGLAVPLMKVQLKTINDISLKGVGNIVITGGGGGSLPDGFLDTDGKINLSYLKDAILSEDYFELDSLGKIIPKGGGAGDPSTFLRGLAGYSATTAKLLYSTVSGGFEWGPIPEGGNLQKLDNPIISFGTSTTTGIPVNWSVVTFATTYKLERDISSAFANPITVYNGGATSVTDSGLTINTTYYYRLKASASGFASSDFVLGTKATAASGNVTPLPPTNGVVNDIANTFSWTDSVGYTYVDMESTLDGGTIITALTAKPLNVGNINKAIGQVGVRIKAATGRSASSWLFNESAYTVTLETPGAPTNPVVDDVANTFTVTPPTGYIGTDLETSTDSGTTWLPNTSASFPVGNFAYAVGVVRTRVKAGPNNNVGAYVSNLTAFTVTVVDNSVLATTPGILNNFTFNSTTATLTRNDSLGANSNYAAFNERIAVGNTGLIMANDSGTNGGVALVLHNSTGYSNNPLVFFSRNLANFKLEMSVNGGGQITLSSFIQGDLRLRIVINASTLMPQYSTDGGTTWIGSATVARPTGTLFLQGYGGDDGHILANIRQSGFTTS